MTAMWFGLAAIALAGAGALLYIDHTQRQRSGRIRQIWAKTQGFTFTAADPNLPATWRRGALAKQDYLSAVDIVSGVRRGEQFFLFDLEEAATIIAVRREVGSDVDIDLRSKTMPPPKDADMELLGAIGDRIVFTTNLEIARRVCDQRMAGYTEALPAKLQMLWSEGFWTLGSLPVQTTGRDWGDALDAVARLSGMLHVLPPPRQTRGTSVPVDHDPGRPRPPLGFDDASERAPAHRSVADSQPSLPRHTPPRHRPRSVPDSRPVPDRLRTQRPPTDGAPAERSDAARWGEVSPFPRRPAPQPDLDAEPDEGPDVRL